MSIQVITGPVQTQIKHLLASYVNMRHSHPPLFTEPTHDLSSLMECFNNKKNNKKHGMILEKYVIVIIWTDVAIVMWFVILGGSDNSYIIILSFILKTIKSLWYDFCRDFSSL